MNITEDKLILLEKIREKWVDRAYYLESIAKNFPDGSNLKNLLLSQAFTLEECIRDTYDLVN